MAEAIKTVVNIWIVPKKAFRFFCIFSKAGTRSCPLSLSSSILFLPNDAIDISIIEKRPAARMKKTINNTCI